MPVPYHRPTLASTASCAAFLDVVWNDSDSHLYGGLLVIDGLGRPLEFAHSDIKVPSGFLWPKDEVRRFALVEVAHALFDACQREPSLLVCRAGLGPPDFLVNEIAPVVPFALVEEQEDGQVSWSWLGSQPATAHPAQALKENLISRGFTLEPFDRVRKGLQEVYPELAPRVSISR